ncbi:MAG: DUF1223 domain-containing protein [Bacteroidota bacterium]
MRALLFLAALVGCTAEPSAPLPDPTEAEVPAGIALVELFTSEGCSSCPPADAVLTRIASEPQPGVLALAFHVDYWDRLGWRDPFGSAAFSDRQRTYAPTLDRRVYTPQVIVNGTHGMVGSREREVRQAISDALAVPAEAVLTLTATRAGETVTATPHVQDPQDGTVLHVTLVQREARTDVTRGENGGRQLEHSNVVRAMKTLEPGASSVRLDVPPEAGGMFVAAWAQEGATGRVLGLATAEL